MEWWEGNEKPEKRRDDTERGGRVLERGTRAGTPYAAQRQKSLSFDRASLR